LTEIRPTRDTATVLALLDKAASWLVARGRTGQWGTGQQSTDPRRIATARKWAESGGLYLAWLDDVPVGALAVGEAPGYVGPATEPELYVNLLVSDRDHAGRGIGAALLEHARGLAEEAGKHLLRLDCYAGDDRALVGYYESQGYVATEAITVDTPSGPWPGQILVKLLRRAA
jgi:GNAT superfamily N-acetyltransferase